MANTTLKGVFLSSVPCEVSDGAADGPLLEVLMGMSEDDLRQFEIVEEMKGFREFCIPAEIVNAKSLVRRLSIEEEDAIKEELHNQRQHRRRGEVL